MAQWIRQTSADELRVDDGALYTAWSAPPDTGESPCLPFPASGRLFRFERGAADIQRLVEIDRRRMQREQRAEWWESLWQDVDDDLDDVAARCGAAASN